MTQDKPGVSPNMACREGFWYEQDTLDVTLCAQDLFLATASLAASLVIAVGFVLFGRFAPRRRELREPLIDVNIDAFAINDGPGEDLIDQTPRYPRDRLQYRWVVSWLAFGLYVTMPIVDAVAPSGQSTGGAGLTRLLIGDGSHALGWLVALTILYVGDRRVFLPLRIWFLLEFVVCLVRFRTDVNAVVHGRGESPSESVAVTVMRVAGFVLVTCTAALGLVQRTRSSAWLFDPLSAVESAGREGKTQLRAARPSQESGASLWQCLFVAWLNPLLAAGARMPLQSETLFTLPRAEDADHNAKLAAKEWERQQRECRLSPKGRPSLWSAMFRLTGSLFVPSAVLMLLSLLMRFAIPCACRAPHGLTPGPALSSVWCAMVQLVVAHLPGVHRRRQQRVSRRVWIHACRSSIPGRMPERPASKPLAAAADSRGSSNLGGVELSHLLQVAEALTRRTGRVQ